MTINRRWRLTFAAALVVLIGGVISWESQTPAQKVEYIGERVAHVEHALFPSRLSVELADAPACGSPEQRVACWLREHRSSIIRAETVFHIDRRAIAAAIAYEALFNVHVVRYEALARWSGVGKVHYKAGRFGEGDPMAKQIEDLGMLPRRSERERERILEDPRWATLYIAAIMRLFADTAKPYTETDISCDRGALVTLMTAWDTARLRRHFQEEHKRPVPFTYNFAGNWAAGSGKFLQDAVGLPDRGICPRVTV